MSLCEKCFYYSVTRYGKVCSFNGTYSPSREDCPNYKSRSEAEEEKLKSSELAKLIISIVDALIQLQPEIERLKDERLRERLVEVCLVAKQVKKLI